MVTTSGTTGKPLLFPLTASDITHLGINEERSFRCAGLTERDRVIVGVTMDRCFMAGLAYYEGLRRIGAMSVRAGSGSPGLMIDMIERVGATAIVSVPGFLMRVANYATSHDIDLRSLGVERLICIGEAVRFADLTPTPVAERLETAWGAKVFSTYGATEIASSMCECEQQRGGHLHPSLHHVEVINNEGHAAADGEIGELVVTSFGLEALPLARYRLGDLAWLDRSRCKCGRATPRLGPVVGRLQQRLKIKGVSVDPASVQHILERYTQIVDTLMIATCDDHGSDQLELLLAVDPTLPCDMEMVRESLRGGLKVLPRIVICKVEQIESQRTGTDRKRQLLVDRRPPCPRK